MPIVGVMVHVEDLAGEFPTWRIWQAQRGTWVATRRHRLTDAQLEAGLYATVCGDDPGELRGELERQRRRADRIAAAVR